MIKYTFTIEPEHLVSLRGLISFSDNVEFALSKETRSLPKVILHKIVMEISRLSPLTNGMLELQELLKKEVCSEVLQPMSIRCSTADRLRPLNLPLYHDFVNKDWNISQHAAIVKDVKWLLNYVSGSFCLSKWNEVTINLARKGNHSCCRTSLEINDPEELAQNSDAIHNSKSKLKSRQMMLNGERPSECAYCWKQEDQHTEHVSHRVLLSMLHIKDFYRILEAGVGADYAQTQVEIYSTSTCQLKCFYCGPLYSSSWKSELIEKNSYKLRHGVMFAVKEEDTSLSNISPFLMAYETAWKKWYPHLTTLRFTGGEPLLATQLWKMLDYVTEHPSADLTISINSNLCVGDKRISRLKDKLSKVKGKAKEVWIHASGEATNEQMEYIRFGSNYQQWLGNIESILEDTDSFVKVTVMNTVNVLCYSTFIDQVKDILAIRKKYHDRVVLMSFKYLFTPQFGDVRMLPQKLKNKFVFELGELIKDYSGENPYEEGLLTESEVYSVQRLIDHAKMEPDSTHTEADLKMFFKEYDSRRGTSFSKTFPELAQAINFDEESK